MALALLPPSAHRAQKQRYLRKREAPLCSGYICGEVFASGIVARRYECGGTCTVVGVSLRSRRRFWRGCIVAKEFHAVTSEAFLSRRDLHRY